MTPEDFQKLIQFARIGNDITPIANHIELINELEEGEVAYMKRFNARDLKMHRAYFAFLKEIYMYLPNSFRSNIPIKKFHKFLQTLRGDYDVLFQFKDGRQLLEYHSISFARMDENKFRAYVKEQIPYIYDNLIMAFYDIDQSKIIIDNIEKEFEKMLARLYAKTY
jgi:hypothetical protein